MSLLMEDDRDRGRDRSHLTTSPLAKTLPAPSPYPGFWATQADRSAHLTDLHPRSALDFARMPPLHEVQQRSAADLDPSGTPQSALSHRGGAVALGQAGSSPQSPQRAHAQLQAQLVLQYQAKLSSSTSSSATTAGSRLAPRTEKERMLAGELYCANADELVSERERCRTALWRFNNAMNPTLGISRDERARLFRDVLQLPSGAAPLENVVVDGPFTCDYGYNIQVAPDVQIGSNCTIMDSCAVSIGARSVIGPNVSLLTTTMPVEAQRRAGSRGQSYGRPITIEDDCWIGAGALIL